MIFDEYWLTKNYLYRRTDCKRSPLAKSIQNVQLALYIRLCRINFAAPHWNVNSVLTENTHGIFRGKKIKDKKNLLIPHSSFLCQNFQNREKSERKNNNFLIEPNPNHMVSVCDVH